MYANYCAYLLIGKPVLTVYEFLKSLSLKWRMNYLMKKYGGIESTPDSKFPTISTSGLGDIVFHHAMKEMAKLTGINLETHPVGYVIWRCLSYNFATPLALKEAMDLLRAKNINRAVYDHFYRYEAIPPHVLVDISAEQKQEFDDWFAGKTTVMFTPTQKDA
jgi:hypothetical protein